MARLTWVLAVMGLTKRRSAISSLVSPSATRAITSRSRSVRTSSTGAGRGSRVWVANSPISRRVTLGDSSASPRATARTARSNSIGSVSLTRKPLAPGRIASKTYSSTSNVVRMTMRAPDNCSSAAMARVAVRPSVPGMRMSMSTTSGVSRRTSCTASSPSAASPTTSMSSWASSRARKPARTRAWSSASTTRITAAPSRPAGGVVNRSGGLVGRLTRGGVIGGPDGPDGRRADRQRGPHAEATAGTGTGLEPSAEGVHPLPHAGDAPAFVVLARQRGRPAAAVVVDLYVQLVAVGEADGGLASVGMADDVGERFLGDAKGGQVGARGHRPDLALGLEPHVEARRPRALDEPLEVAQPRGGGSWCSRAVVGLAEDVEHRAQLAKRLLAGVLDGGQRRPGLVRALLEQVEGHAGLHVDERDVVRQHVVELLGDEQALLAGPAARLLGLHVRQLGAPLAAGADYLGPGGQHQEPRGQPQCLAQVGPGVVGDQGLHPPEGHIADCDRAPSDRPPTGQHRVDEGEDQRREPGGSVGGVGLAQREGERGGEGDRQRRLGVTPAYEQPRRPGEQ